MRWTWRDWLATALLAGILVLYGLYQAGDGITFATNSSGAIVFGINDPVGMAGVAFLLGAAAGYVGEWIAAQSGRAWFLATGVVALAAAVLGATVVMGDDISKTQAWDVQLAAFIALLAVLWVMAIGRRTGLFTGAAQRRERRQAATGGA